MKCDSERFINLYPEQSATLDNKKEAIIELCEENSTLPAEMPQQRMPEQFDHLPVVVRGGMHQPVEEEEHQFIRTDSIAKRREDADRAQHENVGGDGI